MSIGRRLLVHSPRDPKGAALIAKTADWGCLVTACETVDELRGHIEGTAYDMVLIEDPRILLQLCEESDPDGSILKTPLAEIEKRHIFRVLASTKHNRTQAAKILGIDTKTLYNKLKAYNASAQAKKRRDELRNGSDRMPAEPMRTEPKVPGQRSYS
jgi:hypothetical protein